MEADKKTVALIVLLLAGGNITGGLGYLANDAAQDGHTELQRQIDETKNANAECRTMLSDHIEKYNSHITWGRDISVINEGTIQRHDAQIQELYRRLK